LNLADNSPTREVARHYQLIYRHYTALAQLAESGEYVGQPSERPVPPSAETLNWHR
jgi:hypothetical protein